MAKYTVEEIKNFQEMGILTEDDAAKLIESIMHKDNKFVSPRVSNIVNSQVEEIKKCVQMGIFSPEKGSELIKTIIDNENSRPAVTRQPSFSLSFDDYDPQEYPAICKYVPEHSGIEIYFKVKPSNLIIDALKRKGWKWHMAKKCWYAKKNTDTEATAKKLCGASYKPMPLTDKEQRKLDSCLKDIEKHGHFIREQLTEEWQEKNAALLAYAHTGGVAIRCVECSSEFYISADEIQYCRDNRKTHPKRCPNCRSKEDIAFIANHGTPYRNRVYDNWALGLTCIGTGQIREAKAAENDMKLAFEIPEKPYYDATNEQLVSYVKARAQEELAKVQAKYDSDHDLIRRIHCRAMAEYVWIIEGKYSKKLRNLAREYLELQPED